MACKSLQLTVSGNQNHTLLAVDIGGTQVKYGLVNSTGTVLLNRSFDTKAEEGFEAFLERLNTHLEPLFRENTLVGLAISTLGIIDPVSGTVNAAADAIPGLAGFGLRAYLETRYGVPVIVENDGNCVAVAEGRVGAAKGIQHFLTLVIGTGIGGGIVLNGALYRGHFAGAGEWGCAIIDGAPWEDTASMRGLIKTVTSISPDRVWSGKLVFEEYRLENPHAIRAMDIWLSQLATGIANLIYSFNPEIILIGGAVSAQGNTFLHLVQRALDEIIRPDMMALTSIQLARLGNMAGMIGAALCWFDQHSPDQLLPKSSAP